jgi:hypothetical protein
MPPKTDQDERRCPCCGRPKSKLKPFNKDWLSEVNGTPVLKDVFFLRTYRRDGPYGDGVDIYEEYLDNCKGNWELAEHLLHNTYGKETAEQIILWAMGYAQVGSSWECSDCYFLEGEEYDKKHFGDKEVKIPFKEPNWGHLRKIIPITAILEEKRLQEKAGIARSREEAKELYRQKYAANHERTNEGPS